ncbi:hypothetical protein NQ314_012390 [Rhamnusium bicolor]|uniref:Poly(A)-specific ribonuclease PARN n=1 Tax=Rhamnusium bicolor TaxID=1586634 RepID=A0AAV8XDA2_9CUCU|nr:hypothetical protein NQ314_012390 [Rhamnusium bicolor]
MHLILVNSIMKKFEKNCKEFLVIQYGLSIFRYDKEKNTFKQQSYNFYIFQDRLIKMYLIRDFYVKRPSINFLINQGFDFNKLFKEGISYLNISEEDKYRSNLEETYKRRTDGIQSQKNGTNDAIPIPDNAQQFIDDVVRLVYQTKAEKFSDKISLETRVMDLKDRVLFATKLKSREEEQEIEKKKYEEQLTELEDFIGFTKVLRMIVDSGKLVIGHNLCLDFLHTIDKFLTPLPDDYEEFKDLSHSLFSSIEPLKDHIKIEDGGQGYSISDDKEHEAGYDAYITGLSFLSMWKFLGKIFLMVLTDNQYINLAGEDLTPSRDHVFYLTFPKEWRMNNIAQLFSPFGNVYISWLDDTSAYVGLYKKDQAAIALSTLSQSDTYSIMTYTKRQVALAGITTPLRSPLPMKKRKSSEGPPSAKRGGPIVLIG